MTSLDYTAQNALSRYPFKDDATLLFNDGSANRELPNNLFLDAKIVVYNQTVIIPGLASITYTSGSPANWVVNINFGSSSLNIPFNSNATNVVSASNSNVFVALELDIAALIAYHSSISSPTTLTFTASQNLFCKQAITYAAPLVKQVTLENTSGEGVPETVAVKTDSVVLKEGTNLQFTANNGLQLDVVVGAGQGLFDSCQALKDVIYNINDITANAFNNFGLTNDTCYKLTANVSGHGIGLTDTCKPSCTEAELTAFAYYLNRVKDGMLSLAEYIKVVKGNYDQLVSQYSQLVEIQKAIKPAYMLAEVATSSNRTKDFSTIACGIYSPSKVELPSRLSVFKDDMFTLVPNTAYVTQDGNKVLQAGLGYESRVMKCNDVIYHGFVLSNDKVLGETPVNHGDTKFDLRLRLTSSQSDSYFLLPLLYASPNFTVSYTILKGSPNRIKATFQLLNPTAEPLLTSFVLNVPPQFSFVSGKLVDNRDVVTPITSAFGFRDTHVSYNGNCTLVMEYLFNDVSANYNIETTLSTAKGLAKKFIPFYL